ncbi:PAS domain-containing protein [Halomicroarcula sp. GCM10025710]
MAAHSLHLLSVAPPLFDPTSLGYIVSGVVLSAAILQGQLLDVAPVTRNLGREAILEEMDDRVVIVDEAGRIVDVNDAAADLFDVSPVALLGRLLGNELPALAATIPGPGERAHTETRLERNGAVRYYDVRVTPLYRAYGAVSGHLVSLRDVTERRQREQRITVLNRLLRHDIRNEMNVVRGNADLLADHTNGGGRERIDRILTTVDTVVERSNKIGAVSEALDAEDARPLDLTALVDPVVAEARERYSDAEVVVERPDTVGVLASPSLTLAFEEPSTTPSNTPTGR